MRCLGEVVRVDTRSIHPREHPDEEFMYVGLENIEADTGRIINLRPTPGSRIASAKYRFDSRHVLYGKLRPYLNKVCTPDFEGICATDIVPLLPIPEVSRDFLAHMLRAPSFVRRAIEAMTGTKMPRVRVSDLLSFEVPVPPLDEQRRIATKLDAAFMRAHTIELHRTEAEQLVAAARAAVCEGIIGRLERSGLLVPLASLIAERPRNGVSPRARGTIPNLKLSSLRNGEIDASQVKYVSVSPQLADRLRLQPGDFLVCRGSGSRHLVGRAGIYRCGPHECIYPDTMIRVKLDPTKASTEYLVRLWSSRLVRGQIESRAKTSAGIFKINHQDLLAIEIPLPPLEVQRQVVHEFDRAAAVLDDAAGVAEVSSRRLTTAMAALIERAFSDPA
jgi:type I restriction enzyme S subunit